MTLDFTGYSIPPHTREALTNYIVNGWEPGSFLTAVLTNDLFGAVGRADYENRLALMEICRWIYCEAPSNCWGDREVMQNYLKYKRLDTTNKGV